MPQVIFDDSEEQVFEEKLKPEEGVDYNYSTGYESMQSKPWNDAPQPKQEK